MEKFADWLTLGTVEMAKGAFNPEEAWSAEHWMNSLGMATLITGPLESQLLKPSTGVGIPNLPNPPFLKDISSPRGIEGLNKNPVVVTPEGLRIKLDEVHTETNPLTKTPVQEHFNKEMEQLRKGVVEGIEGTDKPSIELGKSNLDSLRKNWNVPETDSIAVGKTDVKDLKI